MKFLYLSKILKNETYYFNTLYSAVTIECNDLIQGDVLLGWIQKSTSKTASTSSRYKC